MTLQEIQALMGNQQDLLTSLGLTYAGEAEDGTPRYVDSNGSLVSAGQLQEMADSGALAEFQKNTLAGQGILQMPSYTAEDWARVNELNNVNYATPEAYFDQLYGDGQMVDNYFVLPENNKQGAYVGTPIEGNFDTGFFQDFLKNAAIMGGAAFGMNALSGALAPTAEAAASGWTSGFDLAGGGDLASAGWNSSIGLDGAMADSAANYSSSMGTGGLLDSGNLTNTVGTDATSVNTGGTTNTGGNMTVNDVDDLTQGGVFGSGGTTATTTAGTTAPTGTAISRVIAQLGGGAEASASDWASVMGTLGTTFAGIYGANATSSDMKDIATQYLNMGAPYRDRLNASYQPGFNLATADPAYQGALDTAAQAAARATSARVGNPVDNPGAYAEMQKYITSSTALPALQNYRGQLGQFGGMGLNTAGAASIGGAQAGGGAWEAAGYGMENLFNPKKSIFDVGNTTRNPGLLNNWRYI